ncbi:MAG: polyprenyl synthetase family protein [Bacteroidales bacterium]|jgi:geranylgeranyl pyrophosphate synthase|nr:polyprenyl synthetase family protein [Bacteroidales bacterium]MDX9795627.1 polyprenyl synthetase family protein [Arcobacteraceae bacterium]
MQKIINDTDTKIKDTISIELIGSNTEQLNEILLDITNLKKQFDRALFARLTCEMVGGNWLNHLPVWSVLEILDCGVLAMDDILDRSERRHGQPTIHKKWGLEKTLCAIEFIKSQCTTIVLNHFKNENSPKLSTEVINLLEELYQGIYEGQFIDIYFEEKDLSNIKVNDIIKMVQLTTGIQIAICGELGSKLGGADKKTQQDFRELGMLLGTLFQIRDDFIDYIDNEEAIGKPAFLDFFDGKKRFPVVIAYNSIKDKYLKDELKRICIRPHNEINYKNQNNILKELIDYLSQEEFKQQLFEIIKPIKSEAYNLINKYKKYPNFDKILNLLEISTSYD